MVPQALAPGLPPSTARRSLSGYSLQLLLRSCTPSWTVERDALRSGRRIAPDEPLRHYPQAAVDRRAVRDALVERGLLTILPRHPKRGARVGQSARDPKTDPRKTPSANLAGIIQPASITASPTVGDAPGPMPPPASG